MQALERLLILHRRPYSNSSLLLECFSRQAGRFPAIARGGQGKSSSAAILQPFVELSARWSGRGEVKRLLQFEASSRPLSLRGNSLYCGFYLNELLVTLLARDDPHPALFDSYRLALQGLADPQISDELLLRSFELQLLHELGYQQDFTQEEESGMEVIPERRYHFRVEQGVSRQRYPGSVEVSGHTLLQLSINPLELAESCRLEARRLMRYILNHYLGGRTLSSRELFRSTNPANRPGNRN